MILRCGLPLPHGALPRRAAELGYDVLVSAGALWRKDRGFRAPGPSAPLWRCRSVALDSAGFVATKLHGGYRWTVAEYVALAAGSPWCWWSAMDLCCEPEIAGDAATVAARVQGTVDLLRQCRDEARGKCPPPMPILQGWHPDDYRRCGDGVADVLGMWPDLVGIGSVCRRQESGPAGLWAVLAGVDRWLPPHVRLHLFGVKGAAVPELSRHPRIASTDSCAWDLQVRRDVQTDRKASRLGRVEANRAAPYSMPRRVAGMQAWMARTLAQSDRPRQLGLWEAGNGRTDGR